jgi:hypothetical protein
VLVDQFPGSPMWFFGNNVNIPFRITGITFKGGTISSNSGKSDGFIHIGGSSTGLRIDHNHFNSQTYSVHGGGGMTIYGNMYGVVDHNLFDQNGENNAVRSYSYAGGYGFANWSQPTNFGGANFLFIENNVFNGGFVNDCNYGSRQVARYNFIASNPYDEVHDSGGWQGHSTGQGDPLTPGCRARELYKNYFNNPTPTSSYIEYSADGANNATGLDWGNTVSGYSYFIVFQEIREVATTHYQTPAPGGYGYCGTASDGNASPWDANSGLHSGGWPCFNQTGRGQGDALDSNNFPSHGNTTRSCTPTAASSPPSCNAWPHNMLEPWYVWMDTGYTTALYNLPCWNGVCRNANLDFFVTNTGCEPNGCSNLTTGVGWGTLAQRPTSCAAGPGGTYGQSPVGSYGVAYWATDANGGNGELYVCTATNTWTAIYTPYVYPHPLINGSAPAQSSGNTISPPTGLTATVQ